MTCPGIDIGHILYTIRTLESGGNYQAQNPNTSASGAYQYVDGTWGGYKGYAHAKDAPPAIQDEKAQGDVANILSGHGCELKWVPAVWYAGAGGAQGDWGHIPGGNRLSIQQYVDKWLGIYTGQKGGTTPPGGTPGGAPGQSQTSPGGCMLELPILGHPCLLSELAWQSVTGMLLVGAGGIGILFCGAMMAKAVFGSKMAGTVTAAVSALPVAGPVIAGAAAVRKEKATQQQAVATDNARLRVSRQGDRVKVARRRELPKLRDDESAAEEAAASGREANRRVGLDVMRERHRRRESARKVG